MKYEVIQNYINAPLLVYDGGEPKKIVYKLDKETKNKHCLFDLWKSAQVHWKKTMSEDEFHQLDQMLKFPRRNLPGEEQIFSHVKEGPVLLAHSSGDQATCEFMVYYTLFEKQPSRYQCFVLAVIKNIGDETSS